MKLVRTILFALAFTLPVSWTVAHAADEAPAGETKTETKKKTKKAKKADGTEETKTEKTEKTEKKAE